MKTNHTRGRGSNPESRKNLKLGGSRNWFVFSRGGGIGWSREFGPYHQIKANEVRDMLEAKNSSPTKPMYSASTLQ